MNKSKDKATYKNIATYTDEDHYGNVKESFKKLSRLVFCDGHGLDTSSNILDVGCATGALIKFFYEKLSCNYFGVDISDELLQVAKQNMPQHNWQVSDALSLPTDFTSRFDISLCIGLLGIFDELDARKVLNEITRCTKKGGRVYILSQFNEYDVDVHVTHRKYRDDNSIGDWEKGWNIFSKRTVMKWLDRDFSSVNFIDFSMSFDLPAKDDPVRTWTIRDNQERIRLTNGLKLLVDLKFIEILV